MHYLKALKHRHITVGAWGCCIVVHLLQLQQEYIILILNISGFFFVRRSGATTASIFALLRRSEMKDIHLRCAKKQCHVAMACSVPMAFDSISVHECPCLNAIALLRRSQPSMLDRSTPTATEGDGNCMFRAVSLAVFGTQIHHEQLRLRACVEAGAEEARTGRMGSPQAVNTAA